MELKVNGTHVDITMEGEKTVGDVLKAFEIEASKNNATTIGITLDNKDISSENFDSILNNPITESTTLDLSVITLNDIIENFKACKDDFNNLIQQMENIPVLLQSGKDNDVNYIIQDLANEIDDFCHTATLSALFPDFYQKLKIEDKSITDFFEGFAPILKDFEEALEAKDTVTVGDLSEYEISPKLKCISESIQNLFN